MDKTELKLLLYRLCDNLEYDYEKQCDFAFHNYMLADMSNSDDIIFRVLVLHKCQSQKEVVKKICSDICRILDNDKDVNIDK